jgi:CRISPR-associated protein Cas2
MRYLIAYDISDNKVRRKFSKHLRQLGMKRIQQSVFVGKIKKKEKENLYQKLLLRIDTLTDRLLVLPFSIDIAKELRAHRAKSDLTTLTQNIGIDFF